LYQKPRTYKEMGCHLNTTSFSRVHWAFNSGHKRLKRVYTTYNLVEIQHNFNSRKSTDKTECQERKCYWIPTHCLLSLMHIHKSLFPACHFSRTCSTDQMTSLTQNSTIRFHPAININYFSIKIHCQRMSGQ